ncbi:hypothetical protein J7L06_10210 [Candidatus Bathyarchaeota archaeon]|nr:hypothetical protein [Candidatus Bathyarchaeota archaeon]
MSLSVFPALYPGFLTMSANISSYLLIFLKKSSPFGMKCADSSKALSFFEIGPSQSDMKILLGFISTPSL